MESNSLPGKIHCSSATANLLEKQAPDIALASRGYIEIKGKGIMHTYWVNETQDPNIDPDLERRMSDLTV